MHTVLKISQPWAVGRQANAIWCPVIMLSNSQLHTWEMVSPATVVGPPTARPPAPTLVNLSLMLSPRLQTKSNSSLLKAKPTLRCFTPRIDHRSVMLSVLECEVSWSVFHLLPTLPAFFLLCFHLWKWEVRFFCGESSWKSQPLLKTQLFSALSGWRNCYIFLPTELFFLRECRMCKMVSQQRVCCCLTRMPKPDTDCWRI